MVNLARQIVLDILAHHAKELMKSPHPKTKSLGASLDKQIEDSKHRAAQILDSFMHQLKDLHPVSVATAEDILGKNSNALKTVAVTLETSPSLRLARQAPMADETALFLDACANILALTRNPSEAARPVVPAYNPALSSPNAPNLKEGLHAYRLAHLAISDQMSSIWSKQADQLRTQIANSAEPEIPPNA